MSKRMALLPLSTLTAIALSLALLSGCAQTEPVDTPYTQTTLNFTPRFLPSPPDGMIYEVWAQKMNGTSQSLGQFDWDQDLYIMRDASGNKIDPPAITANVNLLDWDFLSISIEDKTKPMGGTPGPIMLRDTVKAPDEKEFLVMRFPVNFRNTFGFFSMETPSDGNFGDDASGVWFAIYSQGFIRTQDTTNVTITSAVQLPRDTLIDTLSTLDTLGIDSIINVSYSRYTRFNLDTFQINTVRVFWHAVPINTSGVDDTVVFGGPSGDQDTVIYGSYMNYFPDITYDTLQSQAPSVHQFQNGFTDLPPLWGTGWHYRGWVLGPHQGTGPTTFVRMNYADNKEFDWQKPGRLLFTTGIFMDSVVDSSTVVKIDTTFYGGDSMVIRTLRDYKSEIGYNTAGSDPNPWAANPPRHIPPFPGEDFSLPISALKDSLNVNSPDFDPFDFGQQAADTAIVFVTVEPDNYTDSTKNFPLIVMARRADLSVGSGGYKNIRMINETGISYPIPNDRKSWPHMVVKHTFR